MKYIALLALLGSLAVPAGAQVAVSGGVGTLGLGAELTVGLSRQLDARVGVHAFDYSDRRVASNIDYDATARLRMGTALVDWHPTGGEWRLTGGLVWNGSKVDASSRPAPDGTYDIAGVRVPVSVVSRLDGRADFDSIVPYAGLGWGNPIRSTRRTGVSFDVGVVFQGKAKVHLTPVIPQDSPILAIPGGRQALDILVQREEAELEHDAGDYQIYPAVSLGVWYRF